MQCDYGNSAMILLLPIEPDFKVKSLTGRETTHTAQEIGA